jgi:hypothetical protein
VYFRRGVLHPTVDGGVPQLYVAFRGRRYVPMLGATTTSCCIAAPLSLSLHETLTRAPTCAGARGTLAGLRDNWRSLYSGNVAAWVPLNAVIYGVVPLEERVLAFATFTLAYTVVLSVWLDAVGRDSPTTASDDTRQ